MTGDPATDRWARSMALCRSPEFRACVLRHARLDSGHLDLEVHPGDQMLLHSLGSFDANRAVSQYYMVALQQYRAAERVRHALFGEASPDFSMFDFSMLDFACGFGRLLRFMSLRLPPSRIWASDIQAEATAFVARRYGVNAIASGARPGDFEPGRCFDFIWVASLFSHLAPGVFERWLARLLGLLAPHGALCFSVHDVGLLPPELRAPAGGIRFVPESEMVALDNRLYGTTHVTEGYVRDCLARVGGDHRLARIPRGLANEQDLYVVSRSLDVEHACRGFRRGPWGFVDVVQAAESRDLYLAGWAASVDDGRADFVRVSIDGKPLQVEIRIAREDVGAAFADPRMVLSGWEYRGRLPPGPAFVEVAAISRAGEAGLLYAGFL